MLAPKLHGRDNEEAVEETGVRPYSNGVIKPHHSKLLALARLIDGFCICVALWIAARIWEVEWTPEYTWVALAGLLFYNFFAEYNEVYYSWRGSPMRQEAGRIAFAWFSNIAVLATITFMTNTLEYFSRPVLSTWAIGAVLIVVCTHAFSRFALSYIRTSGRNTRNIAIVGANPLGLRLSRAFASMPWLGYRNLGYYDDRAHKKNRRLSDEQVKINGDFEALYRHARAGKIDTLFITLPLCAEKRVEKLINRLADTTVSVYFIPDFFVFDLLHSRWTMIQGLPAVSVYDTPFQHLDGLTKRLEDILLSGIILLMAAPLLLVIAIAIKSTSQGPVLFKQRRYGIQGQTIEVWKFRTMTVCEDGDHVQQATRNDPRVTRLGAFLRRWSLDELPQFINVLQGTMSIVGPRPHAIAHNELYRRYIHGYMLRHKVKPGITGLAQVNGYRGEIETEQMLKKRIEHDLSYIRHWSLLLDLKIILLTAFKGFRGEKAY